MATILRMGALAMLAGLAGCATVIDSHTQDLMVRTIQDNREIGGAGCVLTNDAGRWFVMTPGHVTVSAKRAAVATA